MTTDTVMTRATSPIRMEQQGFAEAIMAKAEALDGVLGGDAGVVRLEALMVMVGELLLRGGRR